MDNKKIKIVISGIGAVGGYYGGMLAAFYKNSEDVEIIFISRGANLDKIRKEGLMIEMSDKKIVAVPMLVTDKPESAGVADYLICCTKSYDLDDNLKELEPVIGQQTIILPLLNGVNISEHIRTLLPGNDVWEGCVYIGARLREPGVVSLFSNKEMLFFGGKEDHDRQKQFVKILTDAGINAVNPEDITVRIWKKFFMISIAATITAYYDDNIGNVLKNHSDDFDSLGRELLNVARAKGIDLPADIIDKSVKAQSMMPVGATTSMHTDFKKGGRNELETLTGYVVHSAAGMGISAPLYTAMYQALKKKL